jgi:AraC-like DNA-binding protein
LRVAEFIRASQLPSIRHYTLLALALEAGFNSKATFNRAFKRAKGMGPREYLKGTAGKP